MHVSIISTDATTHEHQLCRLLLSVGRNKQVTRSVIRHIAKPTNKHRSEHRLQKSHTTTNIHTNSVRNRKTDQQTVRPSKKKRVGPTGRRTSVPCTRTSTSGWARCLGQTVVRLTIVPFLGFLAVVEMAKRGIAYLNSSSPCATTSRPGHAPKQIHRWCSTSTKHHQGQSAWRPTLADRSRSLCGTV